MESREYRVMFEVEDRHWWFRAKRSRVRAFARAAGVAPEARHLDVGCGTGGLLREMEGTAISFGVDPRGEALAFCRERGLTRLAAAGALDLPFPDASFACVTCLDVLSQTTIGSDARAVEEMGRVLEPGGVLILSEPAFEALRGPHDRAGHIRGRYRRGGLRDLVRRSGLSVVRAGYANALVFPILAAKRTFDRLTDDGAAPARTDVGPVSAPVNAILGAEAAIENAILRWVDLPFGSSVYCVARKVAGSTNPSRREEDVYRPADPHSSRLSGTRMTAATLRPGE